MWKAAPKLENLSSIRDGLEEIVRIEVSKEIEKLKKFTLILKLKAEHEKRKQDELAEETDISTTS